MATFTEVQYDAAADGVEICGCICHKHPDVVHIVDCCPNQSPFKGTKVQIEAIAAMFANKSEGCID